MMYGGKHPGEHTVLCYQAQRRLAAYVAKYPRYCKPCQGRGVIEYHGSREEPPSADACANCVELGLCPRCRAKVETEEHESCDYVVCRGCGFDEWTMIKLGADYGAPEVECLCWIDSGGE
jgi:hypothetical protein